MIALSTGAINTTIIANGDTIFSKKYCNNWYLNIHSNESVYVY